MHKCDNFRELFDPLPPSDQCWILCWWSNLCVWQHLSFQHWLGGEGGRDQFLTFMWSKNSMVRSFFIAFLALKWIKKILKFMSYCRQNPTLWPGQSLSSPTESFQKCPPLRRGSVTHEDSLMLRVLMRLLIINLNKLVRIISRRNRHVPAGDFARHSLWYPWKGYEHRWCEGITWQKKRVQWWLRWWFFLNEEKYKNYKSILGMLRARPGFSRRRKIAFLGRFRVFLLMHCVTGVILRKTVLWTPP